MKTIFRREHAPEAIDALTMLIENPNNLTADQVIKQGKIIRNALGGNSMPSDEDDVLAISRGRHYTSPLVGIAKMSNGNDAFKINEGQVEGLIITRYLIRYEMEFPGLDVMRSTHLDQHIKTHGIVDALTVVAQDRDAVAEAMSVPLCIPSGNVKAACEDGEASARGIHASAITPWIIAYQHGDDHDSAREIALDFMESDLKDSRVMVEKVAHALASAQ